MPPKVGDFVLNPLFSPKPPAAPERPSDGNAQVEAPGPPRIPASAAPGLDAGNLAKAVQAGPNPPRVNLNANPLAPSMEVSNPEELEIALQILGIAAHSPELDANRFNDLAERLCANAMQLRLPGKTVGESRDEVAQTIRDAANDWNIGGNDDKNANDGASPTSKLIEQLESARTTATAKDGDRPSPQDRLQAVIKQVLDPDEDIRDLMPTIVRTAQYLQGKPGVDLSLLTAALGGRLGEARNQDKDLCTFCLRQLVAATHQGLLAPSEERKDNEPLRGSGPQFEDKALAELMKGFMQALGGENAAESMLAHCMETLSTLLEQSDDHAAGRVKPKGIADYGVRDRLSASLKPNDRPGIEELNQRPMPLGKEADITVAKMLRGMMSVVEGKRTLSIGDGSSLGNALQSLTSDRAQRLTDSLARSAKAEADFNKKPVYENLSSHMGEMPGSIAYPSLGTLRGTGEGPAAAQQQVVTPSHGGDGLEGDKEEDADAPPPSMPPLVPMDDGLPPPPEEEYE